MSWNLPRTSYDQRKTFYKDIESLIVPGFLSHSVKINRTVFTLRTLYPSDFFMLEQRTSFAETDYDWRVWFVASCVWMINGINLLEEDHAVHKIQKVLLKLPVRVLNVLFYIIVGLINRTHSALDGTEAFCYESTSRLLWKQCNRSMPNDMQIGGVPGVSRLGLNSVQKMWISYNLTEDERVADQMQWENAKLVASAHAPKGVEKINKKDEMRHRNEEERRLDQCDFFFYKCLHILSDEDLDHRSVMRGMKYAQTTDELEDEMRRWVSGEQDEHDRIVEAYKNDIRQRMEEERIAREKAWEEARLQAEEEGEYMPPIPMQLVGLTSEEVHDIIAQRRGGKKSGARFIAQAESPKRRQLFDKYINVNEESPSLTVQDGELVAKQKLTLNQQVEMRNLMLSAKGDEDV